MLPNDHDAVALVISGQAHTRWSNYRIDSDLQTPADAWEMSLWATRGEGEDVQRPLRLLPEQVRPSADVRLMVGGDVVLVGRIDSVDSTIDKNQHGVQITGRDLAAQLVDCGVPLLSLQMATLEQIIKQAAGPLGITQVEYRAKLAEPRRKVHSEPGQTVWDWLQVACEAQHVWPWMTPAGVLVIGEPDYTTPPVASLVLRLDGRGNNVKSLTYHRSMHSRFTHVTVLGQAAGGGGDGVHRLSATAKDAELIAQNPGLYRPRVVLDGNAESQALAQARAEKLVADGVLQGERVSVTLRGHRAAQTDGGPGKLWEPGQRVHVLSEPDGIDQVMFVMKRTFTRDRSAGTQTQLELVRDGAWLLNLAKIKGKRKSNTGKKNLKYEGNP